MRCAYGLILLVCACSAAINGSSSNGQPSDDRAPLIDRDSQEAELPLNFDGSYLRGAGWKCFEMEWTLHGATESVGRCYRLTRTCQLSREWWSRRHIATECRQRPYATCLRGKEHEGGRAFAICYAERASCQRARAAMLTDPGQVEFVSACEVID